MARWMVVLSVTALVIAGSGILSRPPRAVSAVSVADEIASEISTLTDWPPYAALRRAPRSLRRSWRNQVTALARPSLPT